ncbi:Serine/threonine-protein kinase srk1 [Candida viswanathii]|uniref:Serine/threonine-protein kinase srk1 n=1 Tax=Candida viswanathii TaxID=5486 RepID=A0A367XMH0_9ASCO|nr:Serine/threonine-protein kinase srk1 [Candida viswanathii]
MFENLKAFIRHGKQANDIKKKHNTHQQTQQQPRQIQQNNYQQVPQQTRGVPENPFQAECDNKNNQNQIFLYQPQQQQQQPQVADPYQQETGFQQNYQHQEPQQQAVYNNYTQSDATLNDQNTDYNMLASQLVEEENKQKQKSVTYPNLDNYKILDQMGEGAFSVVYKAKHLSSGKEVAIKILRKFQMDQAQKQAVLKEVTIMRQLNHPNIVKFIEFIDSPTYYYIVQELAPGGEIFTMIVKYTYLSEDLSRWIITQVAQAIRYLHEEVGIVHRDIKPENLLYVPIDFKPNANPISKLRKSDDPNTKVDEGVFIDGVGGGGIGVVKLADFGLSKQIWEHNTKTPCGTVGYTAPEIVRDERYSKEVDMWALGCVLYTLLCGFPPFYDERIETLTEKVAKGEFTFLKPWWDEISDGAKHCVSKLLTVDPKKRYTIDEFLQDPWMKQRPTSAAAQVPVPTKVAAPSQKVSHPIQGANVKYSKKFKSANSDLYSPAAVALRDAFDISTAVHRMGEEAALQTKLLAPIENLIEEEEEEHEEIVSKDGKVVQEPVYNSNVPRTHRHRNHLKNTAVNAFDLNLGGASILERRKHKQIPIQSS